MLLKRLLTPISNGRLNQVAHSFLRFNSSEPSNFLPLPNRELVSIRGNTAVEFLQGLMTNDARLLEQKNSIIYSLFLNVKGRVVVDTLLYHLNHNDNEEPHFVIECDGKCKPDLLKILRFYNIRKKVHISKDGGLQTFVSFNLPEEDQISNIALSLCKDPRGSPGWCWRMIGTSDSLVGQQTTQTATHAEYRRARYLLGLPEGAAEVKAGDGLPLEINGDLANGVSFNKGCYVGQELTARSRFVGVIRKRCMAVVFDTSVDPAKIPIDSPIYHISHTTGAVIGNRPVGWIRGIEDPPASANQRQPQLGLALIRLAECASAIAEGGALWVDPSGSAKPAAVIEKERLTATVRPFAPAWWPKDTAPGIPRVDESIMR